MAVTTAAAAPATATLRARRRKRTRTPAPGGDHQTWATVYLWNSRTRRPGFRTTALLDTGASGGSYCSERFIRAVERTEYGGRSIVSRRGRGLLRAANPTGSDVPPMSIIGTALLQLIFPPEDRIFRARLRVVRDLPLGLILGAGFVRRHGGVIDLGDREGAGSFKPSRDSRSVPLLPPDPPEHPRPWRDRLHTLDSEEDGNWCRVPGWRASRLGFRTGRARCEESGRILAPPPPPTASGTVSPADFCALDWCIEEQDTDAEGGGALPPQLLTAEALDLGAAAWEDGASLRWPMILAHRAEMAGRVSAEVDASLPGPQPHTAQLLVVLPLKPFDLDGDTSIGVAKGVQWWAPGTAPKIKLVNRSTAPKAIARGTQVATAFATNCDDLERMLLLKEPAPAPSPTPPAAAPPVQPEKEPDDQAIRVNEGSSATKAAAGSWRSSPVPRKKGCSPSTRRSSPPSRVGKFRSHSSTRTSRPSPAGSSSTTRSSATS